MSQFLEFIDATTGATVYLNRAYIVAVHPVPEDKARGRSHGPQSQLVFQDGNTRIQIMGAAAEVVERLSETSQP